MTKTVCDLLIRNAQIVSMDPSRTIYAPGSVAVSGQRIVDVGSDSALAERTEAKEVLDADGGIVHPGFIDAHNHIVHTSCRGVFKNVHDVSESTIKFADWKAGLPMRMRQPRPPWRVSRCCGVASPCSSSRVRCFRPRLPPRQLSGLEFGRCFHRCIFGTDLSPLKRSRLWKAPA